MTSQNHQLSNTNNSTTTTVIPVVNNSQKQQATNISGLQTYQLTEPLSCNKYAWTVNCKKSYYLCLATFLNEQNINYSNLYVQPKNTLSSSCAPSLTLLQADASYQATLKTFGFSITNAFIPKTELADKFFCPQNIFINRLIYTQPNCLKFSNDLNNQFHQKENILFQITNPGYGGNSIQENILTTDICDLKNNVCIQYQKDKHKIFDNNNDCLSYCSQETKTVEVIDINAPCLVYPHVPYTNEPVYITSAYNRQKESRFWAPSILVNYDLNNWKLANNQTKSDIQIFDIKGDDYKFLWPYNYDFPTANAPTEQPYGLYNQKFFAFKKPGKYQYNSIYTTHSLTQQINFHYNCTVTVEDNPKYKVFFVTDKIYPADFKHIGANKICNEHAKTFGYTTEFEVLLNLDNLGTGGDVYRFPKIYTDNSKADNAAKSIGLNYGGFACDGAYWRFFASSYTVSRGDLSQFCSIPHWQLSQGWNDQWSLNQAKNYPPGLNTNGYSYLSTFWYSKWFSFPGSDVMIPHVDCEGFTSTSSKDGAKRVDVPIAPMEFNKIGEGGAYVLDKGPINCNEYHPIACIEKTAHTDLERKR